MFSRFTDEAQKILLMTKKEMHDLKHPYVGSEHLLLAILHNDNLEITKLLKEFGLTYEMCKKEIVSVIGVGKSSNDWFLYTPLLKRVIENAILSSENGNSLVTVEALFISLLEEGEGVANRILLGMNIDVDYLYEKFSNKFVLKSIMHNRKLFIEDYAIDMNKKYNADSFDPVVGRDFQVNRMIEILLRRTKNNPILIGDAGVGKTAIVEELVRRIEIGSVPKKLLNKRIFSISMANLVAGTKYRGEFEERINQIIEELEEEPNIILFIDEIHTLVGAGGAEGAIDAANILKPYLARGNIRIIGATTNDEYIKYIEREKALDRRFQKIYVSETNLEETECILFGLKNIYEKYHDVKVSDKILKEIVKLSDKYVFNGKFPDKAIDVFDESCAKASVVDNKIDKTIKTYTYNIKSIKEEKNKAIIAHDYKKASELKDKEVCLESEFDKFLFKKRNVIDNKEVTMKHLYQVIYEKTKIPVEYLSNMNENKIIKELKKRVIGQDNIIEKLVNSVIINAKITKKKPTVLLFVGKSGVGKTFLAKEYASLLYNKESFIRVDMSEYNMDFSVSKIIGSPPGYVGYSDNNVLDRIKFNPYSVLLLDEIEKANPSVLRLFLQAFDDGHMTNSKGDIIDFSHITVFMTSNLGSNKKSIGFNNLDNSVVLDRLKNFLGVEFVNRIDEVLIFNELSASDIEKLIRKRLTYFVEKEKFKTIISTELVEKIKKESNYLVSGARKIDRAIEKVLGDIIFLET